MTGVEAISNGVPAFKPAEWKNARTTLMWMGSDPGHDVPGASRSWHSEAPGRARTRPRRQTVLAEIGRAVFGHGRARPRRCSTLLQVATTLILVLAANTAFADFPRLANFHAGDNFLPRQFTTRGHRLVFSNGIIALAAAAAVLVVAVQGGRRRS